MTQNASHHGHRKRASLPFSVPWTHIGSLGSGGMVGICMRGQPAMTATWLAQSCFLPHWAFGSCPSPSCSARSRPSPITRLGCPVLEPPCHVWGTPHLRNLTGSCLPRLHQSEAWPYPWTESHTAEEQDHKMEFATVAVTEARLQCGREIYFSQI